MNNFSVTPPSFQKWKLLFVLSPDTNVGRPTLSCEKCTHISFISSISNTLDTKMKPFVLVDRTILKKLGYQNTWKQMKDKNGKVVKDKHGKPKMTDSRNDFSHFTVFLQTHPDQFIEETHYMFRTCTESRGQRRKDIWVREDVLKKCRRNALFIPRKFVKHGSVYFIQEEHKFDRFKIGFTRNLAQRLADLQIGNPDVLVVYKTIENVTVKTEHRLHRYFAKYHIRGEWYSVTPDMIDCFLK